MVSVCCFVSLCKEILTSVVAQQRQVAVSVPHRSNVFFSEVVAFRE